MGILIDIYENIICIISSIIAFHIRLLSILNTFKENFNQTVSNNNVAILIFNSYVNRTHLPPSLALDISKGANKLYMDYRNEGEQLDLM